MHYMLEVKVTAPSAGKEETALRIRPLLQQIVNTGTEPSHSSVQWSEYASAQQVRSLQNKNKLRAELFLFAERQQNRSIARRSRRAPAAAGLRRLLTCGFVAVLLRPPLLKLKVADKTASKAAGPKKGIVEEIAHLQIPLFEMQLFEAIEKTNMSCVCAFIPQANALGV